jgi:hypothetical protein
MTLATRSASCTQFCFKQPTSRKFQGYLTIGGQRNSQVVQRIFLSEEWSIHSVQLATRSVLQIPLNLTQISKRTDSHGRGPELLSAKKTQSILRQKETGRIHSNKTNSLIIHSKTQSQTICYLHINCTNFLKAGSKKSWNFIQPQIKIWTCFSQMAEKKTLKPTFSELTISSTMQ